MTARLLIFGGPKSGKTALVRALARAAAMQEKQLGCRIHDRNRGLVEPKGSVTLDVEPWVNDRFDASRGYPIELIEADSGGAAELLTGRRDLESADASAQQIREADGIIIVADAATGLLAVAERLADFLKKLRELRARTTEIGGLPVFVVASQCDRLANEGEPASVWTQRVEAAKEEMTAALPVGFDREGGFGGLNITTHAVAVEPPKLATEGPATGPFGVADLFRAAIAGANDCHRRRAKLGLRLRRTLIGVAAASLIAVCFAGGLAASRAGWFSSPLAVAIGAYRDREGRPPAGHLEEPLEPKLAELTAFSEDPTFAQLGQADRDFVTQRLEQLRQYAASRGKLRELRKPADARDARELDEIDAALIELEQLPEPWPQSESGQLVTRRRGEIAAMKAGMKRVQDWYDARRRDAEQLLYRNDPGQTWPDWQKAVKLSMAESLPYAAGTPIAGLPEGAPAIPFSAVLSFAELEASRTAMQSTRDKLEGLADATRALGLAGGEGGDLKVTPSFALTEAPVMLKSLRERYPSFDRWQTNMVPDAARADVTKACREMERRLSIAIRPPLAAQFVKVPMSVESPKKWAAAIQNMRAQPGMAEWLMIVGKVRSLAGDTSTNPLIDMLSFVERDSLPVMVRSVRIGLPDEMPQTVESWTLSIRDVNDVTATKVYKPAGPPEPDPNRKLTWHTLVIDGPAGLEFHPGDVVNAEAALKDSRGSWKLSWWANGMRSRMYQIDRLRRAPRLHRVEVKAEDGIIADGVRLEFDPDHGIPRLPEIMPEVK